MANSRALAHDHLIDEVGGEETMGDDPWLGVQALRESRRITDVTEEVSDDTAVGAHPHTADLRRGQFGQRRREPEAS